MFAKSVFLNMEQVYKDKEGRYVMVVGTIAGIKITILNIYAPNEDYPQFFKNVFSLLAQKGEGMYLIGGDFNCVLDSHADRLPAVRGTQSKKSKSSFRNNERIRSNRYLETHAS